MLYSESSIELDLSETWVVFSHGLVDIVGVEGVSGELFLLGVVLSLKDYLLSHDVILLKHLKLENFTDFDVMSRYSVVQHVGWKGHSVFLVPVFWTVLFVEMDKFSSFHLA